jgi:hypothetical protein
MLLHVFHQHFDEGVGQEDGRKRRKKMSKQTTKFKKKKRGGKRENNSPRTIVHCQYFSTKENERRSKKV